MGQGIGQLAAGVAGAAIGFVIGGGPVGAQIGWLAATTLFSLLNPPKQVGPRLNDLTLQRSEYGAMIPWVRGIHRIAGNVIWQTDLVEHSHSSGGKGGGGGSTTYTYSASFAVLLCEGPITGIRRIWADGRVIWSGGDATDEVPFTLYVGDDTQDPDPTMEADPDIGTGNVPDYRGYAYIVFKDMPLEDYNNRIPNIEFEVEVTGTPRLSRVGPVWAPKGDNTSFVGYSTIPLDGAYVDGGQIVSCVYTAVAAATSTYQEFRYSLFTGALEDTGATVTVLNPLDSSSNTFIESQNSNIAYGVQRSGATHPSRWYVAGVRGNDYVTPPTGSNEYSAVAGRPVRKGDFVYAPGGPAATGTGYIGKWAIDGGVVAGTPEAEYLNLDTEMGSHVDTRTVSLTVDEEGFLWALIPSGYVLLKIDPVTMTKVRRINVVDTDVRAGMALSGAMSTFTVYRGLLVLNQASPAGKAVLWRINADDTFTRMADAASTTEGAGSPMLNLGGGYVLTVDGVLVISTLDDLASVNAAICEWGSGGLDATRYDVADLAGIPVRGFKLGNVMSKKNAIEELRKAYPYGVAEVDGKAVFRLLNHDPDGVIADADLAAFVDGETPPAPVRWEITNDLEVPRRVTFRFPNADKDFQIDTADATCDNGAATSEPVIDVAVVMTKEEGKRLAQQYISRLDLERQSATFTVPRGYLTMAPLDVWTVAGEEIRIESTKWAPGNVIEVTGKRSNPALFLVSSTATSSGTGSGSTGSGGTTRKSLAETESVLLDIPLILGTDSLYGFYWAAGPKNASQRWPGAVLYRSRDDGTTYEIAATTSTPSVIGSATTALGNYAGALTSPDTVSTVTVRLTSDATLESCTDAALAAGANVCVIKSGSKWEILQFRDVTLVSPQTYQLSHFMRGRLSTNPQISSHAVGDTFVLLPVNNVDAPESDLNVPLLYKAVTFGAAFSSAPWVSFTNTGEGANSGGAGIIRHLPALIVLHTETSYTFAEVDRGKWHIWNAASPATVTLPAGLKDGWNCVVANIASSNVTLDPANNIDGGSSSLTLTQYAGVPLATNGTDYYTVRGTGGAGGGGSLTVKDEGSVVETNVTELNFVGLTVDAISAGAGKITVSQFGRIITQDDGVDVLTNSTTLNFASGLSATSGGSGVTNIDVTSARAGAATSWSNGQDGNLTISSGTTTLTRDMYYDTVTISGTARLDPAGFIVYAKVIDLTAAPAGAISRVGNAGNNTTTASGATGGAIASSGTAGGGGSGATAGSGTTTVGGNSGAPGGAGNDGGAGGVGGAGGTGTSGAGGTGGTQVTPTVQRVGVLRNPPWFISNAGSTGSWAIPFGGTGGRGGGGGGGNGANAGGGGGGGGAGGPVIAIYADEIRVTGAAAGAISCKGGAGGNGANGGGAANTGGGGGGAGGGGGWIYAVFGKVTGTASNIIDASGGLGGNGGTATAGGTNGAGGTGGDGGVVELFAGATTATHTVGSAGAAASGTTGGAGGACVVSL